MALSNAQKSARYRAKDIDAYRKKKREYARSPEQVKKRTEYMRKYREKHRQEFNEMCRKSHAKSHKKRSPEQRHDRHLRGTYGITRDDYMLMLSMQDGKCAICRSETARWKKSFHVDHSHKTGMIRGLLCNRCNPMLGWLETYRESIESYLTPKGMIW